jgi:hypothetical protein
MWIQLKANWSGHAAGSIIQLDEKDAAKLIQDGTAINAEQNGLAISMQKTIHDTIQNVMKEFAAAYQGSNKNGIEKIFGAGNSGDKDKTFSVQSPQRDRDARLGGAAMHHGAPPTLDHELSRSLNQNWR